MKDHTEISNKQSLSFIDFSPLIIEVSGLMIKAISYLSELVITLIRKLISLILEKFFNVALESKKSEVKEAHLKRKLTTTDINSIGIDLRSKRKVLYQEIPFQRHTLILGGTGFGKSNTINNIIDHKLQNNSPVLFFDPKGNISTILEFINLCEYYKKNQLIFSETAYGNVRLNPLKNLNDSQMATLIENAFEWSDGEARYYRDTTISIITNMVFDEIRKKGRRISLPEIFRHMKEYHNGKETSGFLSQLSILMKSPFAHLLEDIDGEALSLMDIIQKKRSVYFGLSVMGYGAISRTLGKLFLNEIQIHTHTLGVTYEDSVTGKSNPISVILDEAGSMYFKDLINLQNKGRSSGIQLILATQTLADFQRVDPILVRQIFNNTGCFFIFSQSNNEDAEAISKSVGTFKTVKETFQTEDGSQTERGSSREVRAYFIHPEIIKNLGVGQCVLFTKDPHHNYLLQVKDSSKLESIQKLKIKPKSDIKNENNKVSKVNTDKNLTLHKYLKTNHSKNQTNQQGKLS